MTPAEKILVVDDEATLVKLGLLIFESAGYQARGAKSGELALQMIREEMPDIILLDVMMPDMTGIEVCRRIRAQYQSELPRILMYTADERSETRENCLDAGADFLISKATPIFDLPEKIRTIFPNGS